MIPSGLTVGYVTSGGWTSRLIEWRSAGGPSHATTLVEPGWVIDARLQGGVQRRPISYLEGSQVLWLRIPAEDAAVAACIAFLKAQVGKPYDWRDIVDFAVPGRFQTPWRNTSSWICSELQIAAEETGILPKLIVPANRITPQDALIANSARGALPIAGPIFG